MSRRYKTGTVSRALGVPPPLLRVWETRHGLVSPVRGPGGQRMYSEEDLEILRAARALVDQGFSIGEIASWPRSELIATARAQIAADGPERDTSSPPAVRPVGGIVGMDRKVILTLDEEGVIGAVSPSIELVLGWPDTLLVGQPLWGLLLDVPPGLERLVGGGGPVAKAAADETGTAFWVWLRRRTGTVVACRLECGVRRRAPEGSTLTIQLTPLEGAAEAGLSPLIDKVDCAGLVRFTGSPEQLLKEYVGTMVDAHGAALARVWTYNGDDGSLHLVASAGLSRAVATSARSVIRLSSYPFKVGFVARTGIPYVHNGLEGDRDFDRAWIKREHLESAAVLPLIADGRLFGVTAQFFRRRLEAADVGRLQASAALCEAWLGSLHRRRAAPAAS